MDPTTRHALSLLLAPILIRGSVGLRILPLRQSNFASTKTNYPHLPAEEGDQTHP